MSAGVYCTLPPFYTASNPVDVNVGVGVVNGGSSGADNEGFWFDEDIGIGRTRREAEELRLQQLQIEQEIQQLEQAQEQIPSYYYVREIPNKPPPPYTPPGEASRNSQLRHRLSDSILTQQNEIDALVVTASLHIFTALTKGEDVSHLQPPDKFLTREGSGRVYNKFLFDLVRQLICEATESDNEDGLLPWDKTGYKRKRCVIPRTQDVICENVGRQIKILFGFEPRNIKENLIIRWSRKKRDHVDELLVRELHEEESEWTDYRKDEIAVKNQLTIEICNSLIADTSAALFSAFQKKIKYSQQT